LELVGNRGAALHADIRERLVQSTLTATRTRRLVIAATVTYAGIFVALTVLHYLGFGYARFDLGNMTQAVWSTAHGRVLETTSLTGEQLTRLAVHADPLLILLTPLWIVWPSPVALLVVQALCVSAGALPVYWLARKHLGTERAGVYFAFAYLLLPATQFNAFTPAAGFHPVSLALPLILYAIWFLDEDRLIAFAIVALLAASTKEEIPAAVGCLGIWYAVRKGRQLTGIAIFAAGLAAAAVNFFVIIPHYANGFEPLAQRYGKVGGTPSGIAHKAVSDPGALLGAMFSGHKLGYVVLLLLPLLGFWLLEPLLLLGAVPDLLINLLSSKPEQTSIMFQYTAGIMPFVFAAAIFGIARTKRNHDRLALFALIGAGVFALYSPVWPAAANVGAVLRSQPVWKAQTHAIAMIPGAARVSASNHLGSRLSERRYVYVFPYVRNATWVVLDRRDTSLHENGITAKSYRKSVAAIEQSSRWATVYQAHGIEVLKRR
jgi:uncharacterized membrane protein